MKLKILFFLLLCHSAFAQLTPAEIDDFANDALKKFNVAGAAIAIVKDGKVVHSKGYGISSITSGAKVNEHTQFAIASNSKAFTTAALAILVDEGKLSWTDKVKVHIPEFTMYNDYVTQNFTIEDLLTHRSGLGLGIGDLMIFPDGSDFKMNDILASFQYFKPESAFRTKFDYDNLLYLVAGEVIKRVSGQTWEDFVQQRIFIPLQMNGCYPSFAAINNKSNVARPHTTRNGGLNQVENFKDMINGAAGGIYANVDDLTKWLLLHLNKGKYGSLLNKKQLISAESHDKMWKIHTVLDAENDDRYKSHFAGYGLGWFLSDVNGNMKVSHTGGLPGMISETTMIPDLDLGVVILTNTENGGSGFTSALTLTILDSYMGLKDFNWTNKYVGYLKSYEANGNKVADKVWETVTANSIEKIKTDNYIGVYKDPWFGEVEVFMKGKQLWFKSYKSPKLNGLMQFYNATTFAIKWEYQDMNADAFATFNLDETGKAQSIKMKGISPTIDFSFDFQDLDFKRVR
jgi:CubicO group peptidase (beta-lactamase class C family)